MIAVVNFTSEGDPFSIRRPARLIVGFVVIGNLCKFPATVRISNPYIAIAILFIFLAGAVRNEGDAFSIRRPLRIAVIPVVPIVRFGNLFDVSRFHLDDPKMRAPVVEPTRVIEFVRGVLVMTHVTAITAIAGAAITWSRSANDNEASSIRRPAKKTDSIFQICDAPRFAAAH